MSVYNVNYAIPFREPVPENTSNYYNMITSPICLNDIRDRNGKRLEK